MGGHRQAARGSAAADRYEVGWHELFSRLWIIPQPQVVLPNQDLHILPSKLIQSMVKRVTRKFIPSNGKPWEERMVRDRRDRSEEWGWRMEEGEGVEGGGSWDLLSCFEAFPLSPVLLPCHFPSLPPLWPPSPLWMSILVCPFEHARPQSSSTPPISSLLLSNPSLYFPMLPRWKRDSPLELFLCIVYPLYMILISSEEFWRMAVYGEWFHQCDPPGPLPRMAMEFTQWMPMQPPDAISQPLLYVHLQVYHPSPPYVLVWHSGWNGAS